MLIATSPRLSSDQENRAETEKSSEEAYPVDLDCMSLKCNSGIFCDKGEDMQTYEEHSRRTLDSQSAYESLTDWITTIQPMELSKQTINAQSPVYDDSVKPTVVHSDIEHHTKQPTEPQGEEFIYYTQHEATPCEGLDCSLQTAVHTDDFCNFQPSATFESEGSILKTLPVQSEELHGSIQMLTVQSEFGNPLQTLTTQSEHLTNHLQVSRGTSQKSCDTLKSAALQSEEPCTSSCAAMVQSAEPFKTSPTATIQSAGPFKLSNTTVVQSAEPFNTAHIQSEEPFKSLKTATVHSEELCSSTQTPVVLSEKSLECFQTPTVHSEVPCYSLWTANDQPQEINRPIKTSSVQSEKLGDLVYTASLQIWDLYNGQTVQQGDHYNLQQCALAVPSHPEVLYQLNQTKTVQAECQHAAEATEDQVDSTVTSRQRSSIQFADPHYVKQASTVQSEELYLSRTCDSHWNDSVTADKVAVEGDLNG